MRVILLLIFLSSNLLYGQRQRDQIEQFRDQNITLLRDSLDDTYEIQTGSNTNGNVTTARYVDSTIIDVVEQIDFRRHILYENERIYTEKFLSNKGNRSVIIEYSSDIAGERRHFYKISTVKQGLIYGSSITYWKNEKDKNYLLADFELIDETNLADSLVKINDTISVIYRTPVLLLTLEQDRFEGISICKGWNASPLPDEVAQTLQRRLKEEFGAIPYNYSRRKFNRKLQKFDAFAFSIYSSYSHLVSANQWHHLANGHEA